MDNGPGVEPPDLDLPDGLCYCVDCGTIFVWHPYRDCPACHIWDKLEAVSRI